MADLSEQPDVGSPGATSWGRLSDLFLAHRGNVSDKWEQYLVIYEAELASFVARGKPVRLLEIGVQNGGSLEIWRSYLPPGSSIVGIDIDPACAKLALGEGISVLIGDAGDPATLDRLLGDAVFDIIVVDGPHRSEHIIAAFESCWRRVAPGGLFIAEDLHCADAAIEHFKALADAVNADHFKADAAHTTNPVELDRLRALGRQIARVTFCDSLTIVQRALGAREAPYRRVLTGLAADVADLASMVPRLPMAQLRSLLLSSTAAQAFEPALRASLIAARETVELQREAMVAQRETIAALRGAVEDQRATIAELRGAVEDQRATIVALRDGEAVALTETMALRGTVEEQRATLRHEQELSAALLGSTSWRVTAPMRLLVRAARAPLASIRITLAIARKARTLIARDGLAFTVRRSIRFVAHYGLVGTAALLRTSSASSASRAPDRNSMDGTMGAVLHKVGTPENARAIELDHSLSLPLPYAASEPRAPGGAVGVILHLDHPELAVEFRSYLRNITAPADLYISVLDEAARAQVLNAFDGWEWGKLEVRVVPNRGRDIAPKLIGLCDAYDRHELVLHLHSKQHDHASVLSRWRHHLLENLVGTPDTVSSVFDLFARLPELGMVAAQHFEPMRHCVDWGHNLKCAIALGQRMGIEIESGGVLDFPSGSMFWARSAALRPLLDLGLAFEDFPAEQGQRDGTPADAIERLYFMVCEKAGFDWIKVARPNLFSVTPAIITTQDERDLEQYLSQYLFRLLAPGAQRARSLPPAPVAAPSPGLLDQLRNHTLGAAERLHPGSRVALGIVAYNNEASGLRLAVGAAMQSLRAAGLPEEGAVLLLDNGADSATAVPDGGAVRRLPSVGNVGFGAGHNRLMKEAFARGTDLYVAVNPDGVLHPEAVGALLRMVQAHDGRALVEALQFPMEHPKPYDPATLDTPWLSGACLAIPRAAHEVLGGFDEDFFMYCEDVDLSWRARAQGFALKTCPTALFLHAVTNRPSSELTRRMMFQSGVILARKWGSPAFEAWLRPELEALGASLPEAAPVGVPTEWRRYADFSHRFSFAKPRW